MHNFWSGCCDEVLSATTKPVSDDATSNSILSYVVNANDLMLMGKQMVDALDRSCQNRLSKLVSDAMADIDCLVPFEDSVIYDSLDVESETVSVQRVTQSACGG